jgi:hypothetical protein
MTKLSAAQSKILKDFDNGKMIECDQNKQSAKLDKL